MNRWMLMSIACMTTSCLTLGCATSRPRGPYQALSDADRNTVLAEALTRRATDIMVRDPTKAEALLRDALTADIFYGPAHNNLGVLLLRSGDLGGAANEFQFAAKLLPDNPDPRVNLAMTFERAGRIEDAMGTYASVLDVSPDHVPTMQALALCQVRHARRDDRTPDMLREIALRGDDESWRSWAQGQLAMQEGR